MRLPRPRRACRDGRAARVLGSGDDPDLAVGARPAGRRRRAGDGVPDGGPYLVSTAAVAVENTHNFGGGTVQPIDELRALRGRRRDRASRSTSTVPGSGTRTSPPASRSATYGGTFDTVSVCLSKGLGAPVGSVLVGSADAMPRPGSGASGSAAACGRSGSSPRPAATRSTTTSTGSPTTTRGPGGSPRPSQVCAPARRPGSGRDQHRRARHAAGAAAPTSPPRPDQGVLVSVLGPRTSARSPTSTSTTAAASTPRASSRRCSVTAPAVRSTVRPMEG